MTSTLTTTTDRVVMKSTKRYVDQDGATPGLSDREWRGPDDIPMFEVLGCHDIEFKDLQVWCDRARATSGNEPLYYTRLATAFHVGKSATRHSHRNKFRHLYINGTGHGPEQGIGTAFSVQGQTNTDFNIWDDVVIECCRWGIDLNGWNNYSNKIENCIVTYADVAVGASEHMGSFEIDNLGVGWVKTVLKMPTATRPSAMKFVNAEMIDLLFDVDRAAGAETCLTVADCSVNEPQMPWKRDPTKRLIGRFLADEGLVLQNIQCTHPAVIEARVPSKVTCIGRVAAEIVQWQP